jgi:hypothetical protein
MCLNLWLAWRILVWRARTKLYMTDRLWWKERCEENLKDSSKYFHLWMDEKRRDGI